MVKNQPQTSSLERKKGIHKCGELVVVQLPITNYQLPITNSQLFNSP
ncbi:MAG: hypothetical protein HC786_24945 [Richelia sp. CSU_2_1]|nr:hypothetical protein [Microcoleus sp. SU_5_6]NJL68199.1 hypothetical protein [Microcoleus sp. SM1_3_4]NJR25168.1 hypothetical protein [Richelia sp. CSU_2_1]